MKKFLLLGAIALVAISSDAKVKYAITTGDENLTALTKVTDNAEPCMFPFGGVNGQNLFFAARENKRYWNIYKKDNAFSTAMTQKTNGKNNNTSPYYCAATDKIVFSCQNEGASTTDIFMMSATKGKALTQITESSNAYEDDPCFNNDGSMLVYDKVLYSYYKRAGNFLGLFGSNIVIVANSEIWLRNMKTGENILIASGYQPRFSPDGKKIAYVKYSSDAKSCSIWIMDIDGGNQVQVTDAKKGYTFYPSWSPDGTKLIFQSSKKDKKDFDLYVVDTDGNNLVQVTKNKSADRMPYWTEDGYIYFVSDRGGDSGNEQIWRFKADF